MSGSRDRFAAPAGLSITGGGARGSLSRTGSHSQTRCFTGCRQSSRRWSGSGRRWCTGDLQALAEYGDPNEAFRRLCQLKREGDRTQRERKRALDRQHRGGWRELYRRQDGERSGQAEDCQSLRGRVQQWREHGGRWRTLAGAIRGKAGVLDEWSRRLDQRHRQERAGQGREHTRAVREQGVSRPRRLGYREERFEAIQQARQGLAFLTLPGTQPLGGPEVTTEAYAKLQGLIQSLPERDRKELERRDQEHPPPAFPQQKPTETPEQSHGLDR